MAVILPLIAALAIALATTPLAAMLARRLDVLDHPGPLKVQTRAVPYLGGLAVFAGAGAVVAIGRPAFLLPMGLAIALGMADDVWEVSFKVRFGCEIAVGLAAALVVETRLPVPVETIAVAVTMVVLINAVNLIDGLDGLATGVGLASAIGFAIVLEGDARIAALGVAGALTGFLVHNRPPARIYLGDGGSYLLGTLLSLLLFSAWKSDAGLATSYAALLLVAAPVAEVVFALVRRVRAHEPLFRGDRGHVYDQLVDRGWSTPRASLACVAAQALLAAVAVATSAVPAPVAAAIVASTALALTLGAEAAGFLAPTYRRHLS